MRTFGIVSLLCFLTGIGWLAVMHPDEPASVAVLGDRVVYAQGRSIVLSGDAGVSLGGWRAPEPVRQAVAAGELLGLVFKGRDELRLFTLEGRETGRIPPPQKADGEGRWARLGDRWLFLHPARQALFVRDAGDAWKLMLPPEEELTLPVDIAADADGRVAVLCEEPPLVLWVAPEGVLDGELALDVRRVPSVRFFIYEDWKDFVSPQRASIPWRISVSDSGNLLIVFRTRNDRHRRLVHLRRPDGEWRSRGVFLPSRQGRRETWTPQDADFREEGLLMSGTKGGLWYYRDERLPPVKPWIAPPPDTRRERLLHQRRWGWILLALAVFFAWVAWTLRASRARFPREAFLWSGASLLVPGLGQALAGRKGWAVFWFAAFGVWAALSVGLLVLMKGGTHVTTVTLFESFLGMGLAWALAAVQAFFWGMKKGIGNFNPRGSGTKS